MTCDKCSGTNIQWSEYEHKIWCYDCEIDTDGTKGIFDGPIGIQTCYLIGLTFDRINLETQQIEKLNLDKIIENGICEWDPPEVWKKYTDIAKDITIKRLKNKPLRSTYGDDLREEGSKYFKLVPRSETDKREYISIKCPEKPKSKST
jgi:hypothetical protein